MDLIHEKVSDKKTQKIFNRVRVNYNILSLSDMVLADGKSLHPAFKHGTELYRRSKFHWPRKEKYHKPFMTTFLKVVKDVIVPHFAQPENQLGKQIAESHMEPYVKQIGDSIMIKDGKVYKKTKYASFWRDDLDSVKNYDMSTAQAVDVQALSRFTDRMYEIFEKDILEEDIPEEPPAAEPSWLRQLWGSNEVTDAVVDKLIELMKKPHIMASDGGRPGGKGNGAYAYVLADINGNIVFHSTGVADTLPEQYASTRVEGYGMLAGITLINYVEAIAKKRGIQLSKQRIFACDNSTVTALTKSEKIPHSYYKAKHKDILLQIIIEWRKSENNPETIVKVEGHLDEKMDYEDMTPLEKMNWWADHYCKNAYEDRVDNDKIYTTTMDFPAQKISVGTAEKKFVSEKPSKYHCDRVYKELADLIRRKNDLTQEQYDMISWDPLAKLLKKSSHSYQVRIMKIIHDKWITNYQQHKMNQHSTGRCPNCELEMETTSHVFECQNERFQSGKEKHDWKVYQTIKGDIVTDTFAAIIHRGLRYPDDVEKIFQMTTMLEPALRETTLKAVREQTEIGWNLLRKGFVSQHWALALKEKADYNNVKFDHLKWERDLVHSLWERSYDIWRLRCDIAKESDETYLQNLRLKAEEDLVYLKNNKHIIGIFRNLIRYKKGYFLRARRDAIECWMATVKDAKRTTIEHAHRVKHTLFKHNFTSKRKRKPRKYIHKLPSEETSRKQRRRYIMARTPCLEYFFQKNYKKWRYESPPLTLPKPPPDPDPDDTLTDSEGEF